MAMVKRLGWIFLGLGLLWTPIRGQEQFARWLNHTGVLIDSVVYAAWERLPAQPATPHRLAWNRQTVVGLTVTLGAGCSALYCHRRAEQAYRRYLRSGDYQEIKRQYRLTKHYDRLTGWAYALAELGFVITVLSFDK